MQVIFDTDHNLAATDELTANAEDYDLAIAAAADKLTRALDSLRCASTTSDPRPSPCRPRER